MASEDRLVSLNAVCGAVEMAFGSDNPKEEIWEYMSTVPGVRCYTQAEMDAALTDARREQREATWKEAVDVAKRSVKATRFKTFDNTSGECVLDALRKAKAAIRGEVK